MAAGGYLPPKFALAFTPGEQAVLAVVAPEVGKRGKCTLAIGHIAALAGVCATLVKRTLRQARLLGIVAIKERRLSRSRNDTNVVTVANPEWSAWLRLRMPRASHSGFQGVAGTTVPSTTIETFRRVSTGRSQAETEPRAGAKRQIRPQARVEGA